MNVRDEYKKYRTRVYPGVKLNPVQAKEVEQAFLSGMLVMVQNANIIRQIGDRLIELGSLPPEMARKLPPITIPKRKDRPT